MSVGELRAMVDCSRVVGSDDSATRPRLSVLIGHNFSSDTTEFREKLDINIFNFWRPNSQLFDTQSFAESRRAYKMQPQLGLSLATMTQYYGFQKLDPMMRRHRDEYCYTKAPGKAGSKVKMVFPGQHDSANDARETLKVTLALLADDKNIIDDDDDAYFSDPSDYDPYEDTDRHDATPAAASDGAALDAAPGVELISIDIEGAGPYKKVSTVGISCLYVPDVCGVGPGPKGEGWHPYITTINFRFHEFWNYRQNAWFFAEPRDHLAFKEVIRVYPATFNSKVKGWLIKKLRDNPDLPPAPPIATQPCLPPPTPPAPTPPPPTPPPPTPPPPPALSAAPASSQPPPQPTNVRELFPSPTLASDGTGVSGPGPAAPATTVDLPDLDKTAYDSFDQTEDDSLYCAILAGCCGDNIAGKPCGQTKCTRPHLCPDFVNPGRVSTLQCPNAQV